RYEQVGELDFSAMYPTMMARFNISPETIGCACCPDSRVPEINYTVCRRRRGRVPQVPDHPLERRLYYKQRKQATTGSQRASYDQRQTALKWCLVTSFGYLGYRNARFGRIEAHEAVTAFAREMLLRAKEVAESHGFRMLHALVESMWLQRPGATRADYDAPAQAVTGATGAPICVAGRPAWSAAHRPAAPQRRPRPGSEPTTATQPNRACPPPAHRRPASAATTPCRPSPPAPWTGTVRTCTPARRYSSSSQAPGRKFLKTGCGRTRCWVVTSTTTWKPMPHCCSEPPRPF